jgi:hypothetical protein
VAPVVACRIADGAAVVQLLARGEILAVVRVAMLRCVHGRSSEGSGRSGAYLVIE